MISIVLIDVYKVEVVQRTYEQEELRWRSKLIKKFEEG